MNPQQFQAQRPPQVQSQVMQAPQGGGGKNLLSSLAGLGIGIATGNPMMAVNGGLGALGIGGGGGGSSPAVGSGGGVQDPNAKKPKTDGEGEDKSVGPQEQPQGIPDTMQPLGQMLDPMQLLMGMSMGMGMTPPQQAPNNMNSMMPSQGFGQQAQPMGMQQLPPQQWGTPGQFWSGGW